MWICNFSKKSTVKWKPKNVMYQDEAETYISECTTKTCFYCRIFALFVLIALLIRTLDCHLITHTQPFIGPLSRTARVSRYQKVNTDLDFYWSKRVSGSGISWAICKSAPRSRQITMPAPHHSVFYRSDALPAAQPTVYNHWRQIVV